MSSSTSLQQLVIGIDIGGTGTKFGIVDRDGNVLFSSEISTKKHATVESFIDELHDALSVLIQKAGGTRQNKRYWRRRTEWQLLYRHYRICAQPAMERNHTTGKTAGR